MPPPELVQALTSPGAYPHPVRQPIRLIQTHVAWVFLTGPYAYKLKKPVDFGFLDFSTLAQRKAACEDELRLNRHFAPSLYQAVLPVSRTADGFRVLTETSPIPPEDYVVQMKEFPQESLFRVMLEHGALEAAHLEDLGHRLALWQHEAPTDAEVASYGSASALRSLAQDNFRDLASHAGEVFPVQLLEQIEAFQLAFLETHQLPLKERGTRGLIRECHGDLHLNNVCWLEGESVPFDCIEFSRSIRSTDVQYDAAFMVCDLLIRNRQDLAFAFYSTWLEHSGDFAGSALLPFYISLRACVRAKIKSYSIHNTTLSPQERQGFRQQTRAFLDLAQSWISPAPPTAYVVAGLSGSGKSTVGRWLARHQGAVHLRSDAIRKHLAGQSPLTPGGAELYTPAFTEQTYATLISTAQALLNVGVSVVLDATFLRPEHRAALDALQGFTVHRLVCTAPEAHLRERLQRRTQDASDATVDLLPQQQQNWTPWENATLLETEHDWVSQLEHQLTE